MKMIKEKLFCIYDIIVDELSEIANDITDLTSEYKIYPEGEYDAEIHMCQASLSLLIKSIVLDNPKAIFLSSLINAFKKLTISSENDYFEYRTTTHALTIFYLRALAKLGVVKIVKCERCSGAISFNDYYRTIGNDNRKDRNTSLYDVTFIKIRNLSIEDLSTIKKIEQNFKISEGAIEYREKNSILSSSINRKIIFDNLFTKQTLNRMRDRFHKPYDSSKSQKKLRFKK